MRKTRELDKLKYKLLTSGTLIMECIKPLRAVVAFTFKVHMTRQNIQYLFCLLSHFVHSYSMARPTHDFETSATGISPYLLLFGDKF